MESKGNKMPVGFLAAWENAHLYAPLRIPVSFGPATPTFRASSSSSSEAEAVSRVFCRHLPASSCYFGARCLRSCFFITSRAQKRRHKKRGIIKNFGYVGSSLNQISNRTTMVCLLLRVLLL